MHTKLKSLKDTDQKALEINLDDKIYGTFAEIGAGQEVARRFFKVGAAAGTIAKSMSAYDKVFSDRIYGEEPSGRYVCQSRLNNMLDHEYELMHERLTDSLPDTKFFVFADTVAAINYQRTIKGHGWLGLRFQLSPQGETNDLVLHVRLKDRDNKLQQDAIGILGVNMLYAVHHHNRDMEVFVQSLMDSLHGRISIDMLTLKGADFAHVDNRLIAMYLVKNNITEVAMFNSQGKPIHPSEFLYRKALMVVRGTYKPPTIVSEDVFERSVSQFRQDFELPAEKTMAMAEITMQNLFKSGKISDDDFIARADMLCAMNYDTIISNCDDHQKLVNYLSEYKPPKVGLVIGVRELYDLIHETVSKDTSENLLVTFGKLFSKNIKVYIYPAFNDDKSEILTAQNLRVDPDITFLYRHLLDREFIVDIEEYKEENLAVFPYQVLEEIRTNTGNWESKLPAGLPEIIKANKYFDYDTAS